jgi:hypothetical protein
MNIITNSLKYAADSTNDATDPVICNIISGNTNTTILKEGLTSVNLSSL